MSTPIAFIDCETTSLRPDRRAWEIAVIARAGDGPADTEHFWLIDADDLDLGNADLMSLKVGRFYERHPQAGAGRGRVCDEKTALAGVEHLTRGAHVVGCVPNFDTEVLGARMRANDICPSWHYHLIDVEALAAGYLARQFASSAEPGDREIGRPPWDSEQLSEALGVSPELFDRHTALGDARWARAIYDAVMARDS